MCVLAHIGNSINQSDQLISSNRDCKDRRDSKDRKDEESPCGHSSLDHWSNICKRKS
jgi:hypothetical protein